MQAGMIPREKCILLFGKMPLPLGILPHLPIYCKRYIWAMLQTLQGAFIPLVCFPCSHTRRTSWICSIQMSVGSESQIAVAQGASWSAHPNRRGDGAEPAEHLSPVLCLACCGRQKLKPNPKAVPEMWSLNQAPQFCTAGSLSHDPHQHLNAEGVMQVSWLQGQ